jgi:hypothetical protein
MFIKISKSKTSCCRNIKVKGKNIGEIMVEKGPVGLKKIVFDLEGLAGGRGATQTL